LENTDKIMKYTLLINEIDNLFEYWLKDNKPNKDNTYYFTIRDLRVLVLHFKNELKDIFKRLEKIK